MTALLLATGVVIVGFLSHTASSKLRPSASTASAKLCATLPKAVAGTTTSGLNGVFSVSQFASSPASMGSIGVKGLRDAGFVGGCASTTTEGQFTSNRLLLSFSSQSGALRFAAYSFNDIAPALSFGSAPSAPGTISDVSGSVFELYNTQSGDTGDIAFAVRGTTAAEVDVVAVEGDPGSSLDAALAPMAEKLTGRSGQVALEDVGSDVSGPVRPVVLDATSPRSSVDLPEAVTVTRLLWQYREMALNASDVHALPLIESGALLAVDRALCASSCAAEPQLGGVVDYSPIVSPQSSWPATFLASVVFSGFCGGQLCVDTFVVVQQRRGAPWRMSLYVSYSGQVAIETSNSGPLTEAGEPTPPAGEPIDSLQKDYAQYLESLQSTGRPPRSSPLANSFFTAEAILKTLGIPPNHQVSGGVSRTTSFAGGPLSNHEFAVDFDVTSLCGSYTWTTTDRPSAGDVLVQPDDRSSYGPVLAPGSYASVSLHGIGMVCFDISSLPSVPIYTVGELDGVVSGTGRT